MVVADKVVGLIAAQMIAMALYRRDAHRRGLARSRSRCSRTWPSSCSKSTCISRLSYPPLGETGDPRLFDPLDKPAPTRDGWICISANTNDQVFAFFDAIGRPELKADPRFSSVPARFANVKEYFEIRMNSLKTKTTAEWLEIFDRDDVPAMPYHTLDGLLEDPHLAEVGFFELKDHPTEGKTRSMRLPNKWSTGARREWNPAPKLGQHSVEILREIGYGAAEIDAMIADGVTVDARLDKK